MLGFNMFLHAVRMIVGNLGSAIRISIPMLLMSVIGSLFALANADEFAAWSTFAETGTAPDLSGGFFLSFFALGFVAIVTTLWTVVSWHRFILLEETPGSMGPRWNGEAVWRYFKAGFVYSIVLFLIAIPLMLVGFAVVYMLLGDGVAPVVSGVALGIVLGVPLAIISYRLSPMLPSAAVGPRLTVGEAWRATAGAGWSFVILAIVSIAAVFVMDLPSQILLRTAMPLGLLWQIGVQWITTMVGASILTTIYGVYVEKRALNV